MKRVILLLLLLVLLLTGCNDNTELEVLEEKMKLMQGEIDQQSIDIASLDMAIDKTKNGITLLNDDIKSFDTDYDSLSKTIEDTIENLDNVVITSVNQIENYIFRFEEMLVDRGIHNDFADNEVIICCIEPEVFNYPIIYGIDYYEIKVYETLRYKLNVFDFQEGDISERIYTNDPIVYEQPGEYVVTFGVMDSDGYTGFYEVTLVVEEVAQEDANYLLGTQIHLLDQDEKQKIEDICIEYLNNKIGDMDFEKYCRDPYAPLLSSWYFHTTKVDVELLYYDIDGSYRNELWALDALIMALQGEVFISDGKLHRVPVDIEEYINLFADGKNMAVNSVENGDEIAAAYFSSSMEELAVQEGVDEVISKLVTMEDDTTFLVLFTMNENEITHYNSYQLFRNSIDAITHHSGYTRNFVRTIGPMNDEDVMKHPYLQGLNNGFTSVIEYVTDTGAPVEYAELWDTDWDGWNDVYIVLHIDDYYIGWYWL